ncbi:MAG: hypothetical protein PUF13_12045, partial [Lachnospiraceae bacterium]|nr:hypothetical protein [Lachnospiraceae bacterium]
NNVICVEAGGPTPGFGCAGRGIITALEKLKELGAYEVYKPDVVLYDVLGDVVCGGFSMPMRNGYADKVFILTSGENMAIHAAANIAMAVQNFKNRGYAGLGGLILNRRDVPREEEKVAELADDFQTAVIGTLSHSSQVALAEEQQKTLMECYPESEMAEEYRALAVQMYRICGGVLKDENDAVRDEYMHKCMDEHMDKYIDEHMDKYTDERMNEHINECMNGQTQEDV